MNQQVAASNSTSRYVYFFGELTDDTVHRITSELAGYTRRPVEGDPPAVSEVHLCFNCTGGKLESGFALHDFFASYPLSLTVYAVQASSAGAIAFLGAKSRKAPNYATFMIHGVVTRIDGKASIEELRRALRQAADDNDRVSAILSKHLNQDTTGWMGYFVDGISFSATRALQFGFLKSPDDIRSWSPNLPIISLSGEEFIRANTPGSF